MTQPRIPEWYTEFLADMDRNPAPSFMRVVDRAYRWGQARGLRDAIVACDGHGAESCAAAIALLLEELNQCDP